MPRTQVLPWWDHRETDGDLLPSGLGASLWVGIGATKAGLNDMGKKNSREDRVRGEGRAVAFLDPDPSFPSLPTPTPLPHPGCPPDMPTLV